MGKKVYEKEFIDQIVREAIETGNASIVARKHGISPKNVSYWLRTRNSHI
ncbi:transposase, partial [Pseudobacteroides sp.]